jgi:predicted RNA-binding Zn-ribbon protein involved in translation (DUF1610 family)
MKLIPFPGAPVRVAADTTLDPNLKLSVGPVAFTCTNCGEQTTVEFHKMVFRSMEFYCLGCGSLYRITNPAFSRSKK